MNVRLIVPIKLKLALTVFGVVEVVLAWDPQDTYTLFLYGKNFNDLYLTMRYGRP